MKIFKFFSVFLFTVLFFGVCSIAEEITLTTYYPAPYGVYEELTATKLDVGATGLVIGANYSGTATAPTSGMLVEGSVGIGTTNPGTASLAVINGNVGIGTTAPGAKLKVQGGNLEMGSGNIVLNDNWLSGDGNDEGIYVDNTGNVGIGTSNPTRALHVAGGIIAQLDLLPGLGMKNMKYNPGTNVVGYQNDLAELFETVEEVEPGDLLVISDTGDLKLQKSTRPYEKGIVGIASSSPAILFEGSRLEIAPQPNGFTRGTKPPVALAGRILCKVSIENGPIERGDLLTSSSTPGHAMKATDRERSFGAVVGKALEPFSGGPAGEETGKIVILVTLQ